MYHYYLDPYVQSNIIGILQAADAVSVTTELLKKAFKDHSENIHVIPNAYNESIARPELKKRQKTVFWRGTDSHIYNLWSHGKSINQLIEKNEDWQFDFMGYYPWFLSKKIGYLKPEDIVLYMKSIFNMAPSVIHCPINPDNFNACRSNIAFIEGSYAGAVSVIPDFWLANGELPGALVYKDQKEYFDLIDAVCKGEIDIKKNSALSWAYITEHLSLAKVNKKRIKLLNNL